MSTGYSCYKQTAAVKRKTNPLETLFPPLPSDKYEVIYADPPWDYGGKMQFDKSNIKAFNPEFDKKVFVSAADFVYPTVKLADLKTLDVPSVAADNCILFMWTTGPQMAAAMELGAAWGFEYKTVAFVWDKVALNPGRYTMSQTEFVLAFRRGVFPSPRGARNIRQMYVQHREEHSKKPSEIRTRIELMFPTQNKLEMFARQSAPGWMTWGLEASENTGI